MNKYVTVGDFAGMSIEQMRYLLKHTRTFRTGNFEVYKRAAEIAAQHKDNGTDTNQTNDRVHQDL